jgi:hypothetical protein
MTSFSSVDRKVAIRKANTDGDDDHKRVMTTAWADTSIEPLGDHGRRCLCGNGIACWACPDLIYSALFFYFPPLSQRPCVHVGDYCNFLRLILQYCSSPQKAAYLILFYLSASTGTFLASIFCLVSSQSLSISFLQAILESLSHSVSHLQ